ncbi:MAG: ABC transporter ATP-binding protein/permease [Desulfobulbaceae bacterium]|nr:ABC transporter ATP-binding protein/permease [Desulfobulbaceae bacterium]
MSINRSHIAAARKSLPLLGPFFRLHRARLALGLAALLGVDFLQLFIPRVIKHAVDAISAGSINQNGLLRLGAIILLLALAIATLRFAWRSLILVFARHLETDLNRRLLDHVLTLDRAFFQKHTTGEIMALSSNDLSSIQMACGMGLVAATDAVVMTIAALACMAYISPALTIIAILPLPILAFCTAKLTARLHHRFKKVQEQFSRITEFARANLAAIRLVKSCTQEHTQIKHFDQMGRTFINNNMQVALVQGTLFPLSRLVANLSLLLVLYGGGRLAIGGIITVGDFVAFITYLYMLTWPMMAMGWVTTLFQRGITSLSRLNEVFETKSTILDPKNPLTLPEKTENLEIRNLTFHYPGHREVVLDDLTVSFKPGVTGIIGRTGCGKSSLCQLPARLYNAPDNTIFIDNLDINQLRVSALRHRISYVPQEATLFSDSIANNISMGQTGASPEQIEAVAKVVAIDEEIKAMPEGYQTKIGEKGAKLSGGQRQRIALARALLQDRPILILDDTLAAVDQHTEQQIIEAIRPYLVDRICIIASHRLAILSDADEIIVLDHGRIVGRGNHAELMQSNDFYATIHKHQDMSTTKPEVT